MDTAQKYAAYIVVKILSLNRNGLETYECLPSRWIKVKDDSNDNVVFGYPLEDKLITKLRVIEYQPLDVKWPTFYGDVVHDTDSQEDAFKFLRSKINDNETSNDQPKGTSNQGDNETEITSPNKKKTSPMKLSLKKTDQSSKRKVPDQENTLKRVKLNITNDKRLEQEILEAHELIRACTSDLDKETAFPSTLNLPNETDNATVESHANKENDEEITGQPVRKSTRQSRNLSQHYMELSDEDFDKSEDSDFTCESDTSYSSSPVIVDSENNVALSDSSSKRQNSSNRSKQSVPAGINSQGQDMNLLNNEVFSNCYNFYVELNTSYQKTMSILDNAAEYLENIISTHKGNVAAKGKLSSPSRTNQQLDDINYKEFAHPQPLLQERPSSNSSSDNEDTRWTLRYPEPGLGITELLPHSGVYVSENGLIECKTTQKETTKLTRGLLKEVFTDEALKTCSFSGVSRKKNRKYPGLHKPGLDIKARETLVAYVLKYALENDWDKADPDIIISCIRNRLQKLHRPSF